MELLPFLIPVTEEGLLQGSWPIQPQQGREMLYRSLDNYSWEAFLVSESFTPTTRLQESRP